MEAVRNTIDRLIVFGNREPVLTIRRVLWVVTFGWALALMYLVYASEWEVGEAGRRAGVSPAP